MSDIYAMRRANGDWFAFEVGGRLRVPVFNSPEDARISRVRNFGMLLFKAVALDANFLQEISRVGVGGEMDFCIIKDPHASLKRAKVIEHAQLAMQIPTATEARL